MSQDFPFSSTQQIALSAHNSVSQMSFTSSPPYTPKKFQINQKTQEEKSPLMNTLLKGHKSQPSPTKGDLAMTPRPAYIQKIILYDKDRQKHPFNLYRDSDLGFSRQVQNVLITSENDDDKQTTSSILGLGMGQTMKDLEEAWGKHQRRNQVSKQLASQSSYLSQSGSSTGGEQPGFQNYQSRPVQ